MIEKKLLHVYLVSDSTGETVINVARSSLAHFSSVMVEEHLWSFVLTDGKISKLKKAIQEKPGIVFFTLANVDLQEKIQNMCEQIGVLCIAVISPIIKQLSEYLQEETLMIVGRQHQLNEGYFSRLSAVNFAMSHDDGQLFNELDEADIILVGVSRTSKSPTCLYLAYKGYKTANVPYVQGNNYVKELIKLKKPLIVALVIKPDILSEIRKNRIFSYSEKNDIKYINEDDIESEIREAKKLFHECNWPIIDVTSRSVEETAALIIQIYEKYKAKSGIYE